MLPIVNRYVLHDPGPNFPILDMHQANPAYQRVTAGENAHGFSRDPSDVLSIDRFAEQCAHDVF